MCAPPCHKLARSPLRGEKGGEGREDKDGREERETWKGDGRRKWKGRPVREQGWWRGEFIFPQPQLHGYPYQVVRRVSENSIRNK